MMNTITLMQKRSDMKNKVIKTEQEYEQACERLYNLMHRSASPVETGSEEGEEMELLSLLIDTYESKKYRMGPPDPVEAIKFRMDQMNLKQSDIAPLFGGKTRVSEILNRKRPLNLKTIVLLHRYLGIPLESLISGKQDIKLETNQKEQLLKHPSIRSFIMNKV